MTFTTFTGLTETMADRLAKDLLACVFALISQFSLVINLPKQWFITCLMR